MTVFECEGKFYAVEQNAEPFWLYRRFQAGLLTDFKGPFDTKKEAQDSVSKRPSRRRRARSTG